MGVLPKLSSIYVCLLTDYVNITEKTHNPTTMTQSDTDSHLVSFRVNTALHEWIKRQAIPTESPGKTVQRLIKALAADHKEKLVNDFSTVEFSQADLDSIDKMRTLVQDLVTKTPQ